ncbi:hypothetical protein [Yinghuangia sp. YIM S09857]|uniref:hypothetical protein n=1 Tax=Yinghuangia sp. YIM S09857 TaxID=3436929 RepID=UPI003F53865B
MTYGRRSRQLGGLRHWTVAAVCAVAVTAACSDDGDGDGDKSSADTTSSATTATAPPSTPAPTPPPRVTPGNLLTAEGAQRVVTALREATGTAKVAFLEIDGSTASALVPLASEPGRQAFFAYADGVFRRTGDSGATVEPDDRLIDLDTIAWHRIPQLVDEAQKLNVPNANRSFVLVSPEHHPTGFRVCVKSAEKRGCLKVEADGTSAVPEYGLDEPSPGGR